MSKYVPQGYFLYCDKGVIPTPFRGLEYTEVFLTDVPIATDYDNKPIFNVLPFGPCVAKGGQPCLPAPTGTWIDPSATFCGLVAKPILADSTLSCAAPGTIRIAPSFMEALTSMYDDPAELMMKFLEYMATEAENDVNQGIGFLKGAWETIKFAGMLANEVNPGAQLVEAWLDPEGFQAKWQGRFETAKDIAEFADQIHQIKTNPAKQIQVLWYLSDAENWEKAFDTVYDLADTAYDTVAYADHTEAAQVEGMIAFEVVLEILTSGFGAARHVDKIDDIADGAKVIGNVMENLEDSGKLAENLKQLAADDVPKIDDIPNGPAGETLTGQADEVPPIYATPVPGSPADEARKANPYEETKIDEIRDEHGIGRKKNVAYVEGVIDGNSVDIQSHSGQKSKPGTVEAKPFEEQQLDTSPTERDVEKGQTADDRRAYDSEVKAMEEILDNTTPESTGKIKIVTERNLCDSCANAVEQFRELRPNIEVETVYSIPYNN